MWKNEKFFWIVCQHLLKLSEKPSSAIIYKTKEIFKAIIWLSNKIGLGLNKSFIIWIIHSGPFIFILSFFPFRIFPLIFSIWFKVTSCQPAFKLLIWYTSTFQVSFATIVSCRKLRRRVPPHQHQLDLKEILNGTGALPHYCECPKHKNNQIMPPAGVMPSNILTSLIKIDRSSTVIPIFIEKTIRAVTGLHTNAVTILRKVHQMWNIEMQRTTQTILIVII